MMGLIIPIDRIKKKKDHHRRPDHNEAGMMDDWISVHDRLPETCKPVLVWVHWGFQDDECTVAEYWGDSNVSPGWGELDPYVTHWMPLPGGPK